MVLIRCLFFQIRYMNKNTWYSNQNYNHIITSIILILFASTLFIAHIMLDRLSVQNLSGHNVFIINISTLIISPLIDKPKITSQAFVAYYRE